MPCRRGGLGSCKEMLCGHSSATKLAHPLLCFQVAAVAGVYEVLDGLGFPELEQLEDEEPLRRLRGRWRAQSGAGWPSRGNFV